MIIYLIVLFFHISLFNRFELEKYMNGFGLIDGSKLFLVEKTLLDLIDTRGDFGCRFVEIVTIATRATNILISTTTAGSSI